MQNYKTSDSRSCHFAHVTCEDGKAMHYDHLTTDQLTEANLAIKAAQCFAVPCGSLLLDRPKAWEHLLWCRPCQRVLGWNEQPVSVGAPPPAHPDAL